MQKIVRLWLLREEVWEILGKLQAVEKEAVYSGLEKEYNKACESLKQLWKGIHKDLYLEVKDYGQKIR